MADRVHHAKITVGPPIDEGLQGGDAVAPAVVLDQQRSLLLPSSAITSR
jgi:hypothetical protein